MCVWTVPIDKWDKEYVYFEHEVGFIDNLAKTP